MQAFSRKASLLAEHPHGCQLNKAFLWAHLDKLHIPGLVTSQMLHALVSRLGSIVQVVDDGYPASMIEQTEDSVAACKPRVHLSTSI